MNDDTLKTELENSLALAVKDMARFSGVQIQGGHALFSLFVDPALGSEMETLRLKAEKAALAITGINKVTAILTAEKEDNRKKPKPLAFTPDIGKIIAVASGKGGVGKSTVALNLAVALAEAGYKTGLMDADVYGPSQPRMLGVSGRPASAGGDMVKPLESYGVHLMSMGLLVPDDTAMIWRGPMVQSALTQMLDSVAWGVLDVIIIDLPPGTGDIQISLAQQVNLAGAVIVSTPQDIALLDVVKALTMFEKANVPVLGMVENMSHWSCPDCGRKDHIFGDGGAAREAEKRGIELLGEIPLSMAVRVGSDSGTPIVVAEPQSEQVKTYRTVAKRLMEVADLRNEEST